MFLNFAFATLMTIGAAAMPSTNISPPQNDMQAYRDVKISTLTLAARPSNLDLPAPPPVAATPKADLGVFHSVAISAARLPAAAKWQAARQTNYAALFGPDCASSGLAGCDSRFATKIRALDGRVASLSDRDMLDLVNRTVNGAITYRADSAVWGVSDYWATPVEMARKGAGDCEDFAVAKYWVLRSLGVDDGKLQLVLLQDTRRQLFHAVLVVHTASGPYVLDNVSNRLEADTAYAQYQPIMSFTGNKSYIHGFMAGTTSVAAMPKDLSSVAPGLGL